MHELLPAGFLSTTTIASKLLQKVCVSLNKPDFEDDGNGHLSVIKQVILGVRYGEGSTVEVENIYTAPQQKAAT